MDSSEFYLEELDFIEEIKSSDSYLKLKRLSKEIDDNKTLNALAKERDECYQLANDAKDDNKSLLIKAKKLDDGLRNHPLVKEYLKQYQEVKNILKIIEEGILLKIK